MDIIKQARAIETVDFSMEAATSLLVGGPMPDPAEEIDEAMSKTSRADAYHRRIHIRLFNMNRSDVGAILNADPETPRRLEEMLEWLDLADRLRGDERRWLRDVQAVCMRCQAAGQCENWLSGDRKGDIGEFCPNAETFKALRG
jgi:Family of unknown function (DUF6455)